MEFDVSMERSGMWISVVTISGDDSDSAVFRYADAYLRDPEAVPISLSLPLQAGYFSAPETRTFFEGMLPEGFMHRAGSGGGISGKPGRQGYRRYSGVHSENRGHCLFGRPAGKARHKVPRRSDPVKIREVISCTGSPFPSDAAGSTRSTPSFPRLRRLRRRALPHRQRNDPNMRRCRNCRYPPYYKEA